VQLRVVAGQELTHFTLYPGEEVRSPLMVLQFWRGDRLEAQAAGNSEALAGTSPALQAAELRAQAAAFDLRPRAAGLARQPLLVLTSDDGLKPTTDPLVAAARAAGGKVTEGHQATDHSWSDARIALATRIHDWLETLPARR
jgi:hypothetical protein